MKTKFLIPLLFTLLSINISCSNSSTEEVLPNNNQATEVTSIAMNGNWRITSMIDSGENKTTDFQSFNFEFNENGVLNALSSNVSYEGTWSVTDSNSNDDSIDDLHFNIFFNLTNDFEDLNDDWDIVTFNSSRIELIDISGGNGGTDYLTFEKN